MVIRYCCTAQHRPRRRSCSGVASSRSSVRPTAPSVEFSTGTTPNSRGAGLAPRGTPRRSRPQARAATAPPKCLTHRLLAERALRARGRRRGSACSSARQAEMISRNSARHASRRQRAAVALLRRGAGPAPRARGGRPAAALQLADLARQLRALRSAARAARRRARRSGSRSLLEFVSLMRHAPTGR